MERKRLQCIWRFAESGKLNRLRKRVERTRRRRSHNKLVLAMTVAALVGVMLPICRAERSIWSFSRYEYCSVTKRSETGNSTVLRCSYK